MKKLSTVHKRLQTFSRLGVPTPWRFYYRPSRHDKYYLVQTGRFAEGIAFSCSAEPFSEPEHTHRHVGGKTPYDSWGCKWTPCAEGALHPNDNLGRRVSYEELPSHVQLYLLELNWHRFVDELLKDQPHPPMRIMRMGPTGPVTPIFGSVREALELYDSSNEVSVEGKYWWAYVPLSYDEPPSIVRMDELWVSWPTETLCAAAEWRIGRTAFRELKWPVDQRERAVDILRRVGLSADYVPENVHGTS